MDLNRGRVIYRDVVRNRYEALSPLMDERMHPHDLFDQAVRALRCFATQSPKSSKHPGNATGPPFADRDDRTRL